jgi:hypothetical protein
VGLCDAVVFLGSRGCFQFIVVGLVLTDSVEGDAGCRYRCVPAGARQALSSVPTGFFKLLNGVGRQPDLQGSWLQAAVTNQLQLGDAVGEELLTEEVGSLAAVPAANVHPRRWVGAWVL